MNHGSPQHQDPQQAWPSFLDGPASMQFGSQPAPAPLAAAPSMQFHDAAPVAAQAWGLAAPQAPVHHHQQQFQPAQPGHPMHGDQHRQVHAQAHAQHPTMAAPTHAQLPQAPIAYAPGHAAPAPHGEFAFPTPHGMQIVHQPQPGGVATTTTIAPAAPPTAAPARAASGKRVRWEVIVPVGTALVLVATAFVLFTNFDRITGTGDRTAASSRSEEAAATTGSGTDTSATADDAAEYSATDIEGSAEPKLDPAEQRAALAKAKQLVKLGRYDEAIATVAPLMPASGKLPPAVELLRSQVTAKSKVNDMLLAQLGRQRQAGAWSAVLTTLAAIEKLHPLNASQQQLRTSARAKVAPKAKTASATAQPARTVTNAPTPAATGGGSTAKVPAVARPAKAPTSPGSAAAGGGASAAGGTPPSNTSPGSAPAQPGVANPSSASTSPIAGQPAAAAECGAHAGMTMHGEHCD